MAPSVRLSLCRQRAVSGVRGRGLAVTAVSGGPGGCLRSVEEPVSAQSRGGGPFDEILQIKYSLVFYNVTTCMYVTHNDH